MGLENLKSVFNDLSENVVSEAEINGFSNIRDNTTHQDASRNPHVHYKGYGGRSNQGIHGGLTNERPSTPVHPDDHSLLDFLPNVPLLGPDNLSMSPTLESRGRHGDLIIKKSGQKEVDKPHPDNHSQLDNIEENLATLLDLQTNSTAGKIVFPDNGSVDYSPLVSDKVGPSVGLNTFSQLLDENINKRSFDPSTLGKDQELGKGDYTLETLYLNNHRGSPERAQIDTGKKDWQGNAITINTGRAGMGALSNLDIKGYSGYYRRGLLGGLANLASLGSGFGTEAIPEIKDFGKEPYVVHNIPKGGIGSALQGVGQNRDFVPFRAALDDVSRLAQFYTSPAGIAFMTKENLTNVAIGDGLNVGQPFGFVMAPPRPVPNTGFLNFVQQKVQGAGFGSIRRPFKIPYSERVKFGVGFGNLGDQTLGIEELQTFKIDPDASKIVKKGLHKLKDVLIKKLAKVAQVPLIGLPTPFIDLSGGPTKNIVGRYEDKVNITAPTNHDNGIADTFTRGDFYVKIKDLRKGGLFLYFRGFVTGIVENVNPSWTPTNYIGRSEPVYMYERAERDLSFNLRVYPNNELEFNNMYEKIDKLTSLAYPKYLGRAIATDSEGNDVMWEKENLRMQPPFTELYMAHIGSRKKGQFGFIKSLSYTVNDSGDWDALSALPRLFDIAISYQILNRKPPQMGDKFYRASV